jgi:hypothetical protein
MTWDDVWDDIRRDNRKRRRYWDDNDNDLNDDNDRAPPGGQGTRTGQRGETRDNQQGESATPPDEMLLRLLRLFPPAENHPLPGQPYSSRQSTVFPDGPDRYRVEPASSIRGVLFVTPDKITYSHIKLDDHETFKRTTLLAKEMWGGDVAHGDKEFQMTCVAYGLAYREDCKAADQHQFTKEDWRKIRERQQQIEALDPTGTAAAKAQPPHPNRQGRPAQGAAPAPG